MHDCSPLCGCECQTIGFGKLQKVSDIRKVGGAVPSSDKHKRLKWLHPALNLRARYKYSPFRSETTDCKHSYFILWVSYRSLIFYLNCKLVILAFHHLHAVKTPFYEVYDSFYYALMFQAFYAASYNKCIL